eukprot:1095743-Prorocentrum_minimum.AAC.1
MRHRRARGPRCGEFLEECGEFSCERGEFLEECGEFSCERGSFAGGGRTTKARPHHEGAVNSVRSAVNSHVREVNYHEGARGGGRVQQPRDERPHRLYLLGSACGFTRGLVNSTHQTRIQHSVASPAAPTVGQEGEPKRQHQHRDYTHLIPTNTGTIPT